VREATTTGRASVQDALVHAAYKVCPPMSLISCRRHLWPLPALATPGLAFSHPESASLPAGPLDLANPALWLGAFSLLGVVGMGLGLALLRLQRRRLRQRKVELQRVRRERTKLSALLNAIPDPVFFKDASGAYEACNPAFLDCLGLDEETLLGRRDEQLAERPAWAAALAGLAAGSTQRITDSSVAGVHRICNGTTKESSSHGPGLHA